MKYSKVLILFQKGKISRPKTSNKQTEKGEESQINCWSRKIGTFNSFKQ